MNSKKQILLCPGPVIVERNIFSAMTNNIGHREGEFSELLERINCKMLDLFEIKKKDAYYPVFITGSGTAANEAVLSSIVGSNHILIISNGEFGERLHTISRIHNKNTHYIKFPWAQPFDLQKIEKYLMKHSIDTIAMVHHETSTGMINPVGEIGELSKKYNTQLFVDCVSSVGAEEIFFEKWNITFATTGTGKAIASLPGLGVIIGKKSAFEKLKYEKIKVAYLNLYNLYYYSYKIKQTPNTPAVHLFYALDQALTNIFEIGLNNWRDKIKNRAEILRVGMRNLGLEFLIDENLMSRSITTVFVPKNTSLQSLRNELKGRSIVIYGGKGPLSKTVFQVGNIGSISKSNLKLFLKSLEEAIDPPEIKKAKQSTEKHIYIPRLSSSTQTIQI